MIVSCSSVFLVKLKSQLIRVLLALPLSLSIAGCQPPGGSEQDAKDRAIAEEKLQTMLAEKEQRVRLEAQRRLAQEQEAEQIEAQRLAELQKPHYLPERLAHVAKPRAWAAITVPDVNVKAVFNSTWSNNKLNYRVALLGQEAAIDAFMGGYRAYHVNLADQSGSKIFEFELLPADFRWAATNVNNRIPTMESTGAVECELPRYEQSVQWNLTWSN